MIFLPSHIINSVLNIIIWLFKIIYSDWLTSGPQKPIFGPWSVFSVSWNGVPDGVYYFKQPNCFRLSKYVYRIMLPSETGDSRFNSREKHMLKFSSTQFSYIINSLQFIDLTCSVCSVKYQTSVFCIDLAPSLLDPY